MKLTIDIPDTVVEQNVRDILESYPEYSFCLRCVDWKYKIPEYKFVDDETGKTYKLTLPAAIKAYHTLLQRRANGEFAGLPDVQELSSDPGAWDAIATDCLVQIALLGDVIYG